MPGIVSGGALYSLINGPQNTQGVAAFQFNTWVLEPAHDAIIAFAGGAQTGATQILGEIARITTVVSSGDSVMLPQALAGFDLLLINDHATNAVTVWGFGSDVIDGNASVSHMAKSTVLYVCTAAGQWRTEGLATGWGGSGLQTFSSQDNLTAHSGGGQGFAPTINRMINRVTVVGAAADSITLPASVAGMQIICINAAGVNSMNIFPATSEQINALGANAAFACAAGKTAQFTCCTAGQWHSILSA